MAMRDTSDIVQTQINALHRSAFSTLSSDEPPTAGSAVFYTRQVLTHTLLYLHGLRYSKLPLHPGHGPSPINGIDGIVRRSQPPAYRYESVEVMAHHYKVLRPSPPCALEAQNSRPGPLRCACPCFLLITVVCSVLRLAPRSGAGMCRIRFVPGDRAFSPYPPQPPKKKNIPAPNPKMLLYALSNLQGVLVWQIVWGGTFIEMVMIRSILLVRRIYLRVKMMLAVSMPYSVLECFSPMVRHQLVQVTARVRSTQSASRGRRSRLTREPAHHIEGLIILLRRWRTTWNVKGISPYCLRGMRQDDSQVYTLPMVV
ncbi:hypothetical protein BDV10DRAFT_98772 [Aspergillus recurvatus]